MLADAVSTDLVCDNRVSGWASISANCHVIDIVVVVALQGRLVIWTGDGCIHLLGTLERGHFYRFVEGLWVLHPINYGLFCGEEHFWVGGNKLKEITHEVHLHFVDCVVGKVKPVVVQVKAERSAIVVVVLIEVFLKGLEGSTVVGNVWVHDKAGFAVFVHYVSHVNFLIFFFVIINKKIIQIILGFVVVIEDFFDEEKDKLRLRILKFEGFFSLDNVIIYTQIPG